MTGRVADGEGRGLPGVVVTARQVVAGKEQFAVTGNDGFYSFERLPATVYDLSASLEGFEIGSRWNLIVEAGSAREVDLAAAAIESQSTVGMLVFAAPSLRQLFGESSLVAFAVVEGSEVLTVEDDVAEVATRLRIERRFKGEADLRVVTYRHSEDAETLDPESGQTAEFLKVGEELLVFLNPAETSDELEKGLYEPVGYSQGIRSLAPADRDAYRDRLAALADLERAARRRSGAGSRRGDGMAGRHGRRSGDPRRSHFRALRRGELLRGAGGRRGQGSRRRGPGSKTGPLPAPAQSARPGDGQRSIFLGAELSARHQRRLTAALVATGRLDPADRTLFQLVRGWDQEAADRWLVKMLGGSTEIAQSYSLYHWLIDRGQELETERGDAFAASAEERWDALAEQAPDDHTPAAEEQLEKARIALVHALMRELAAVLDKR